MSGTNFSAKPHRMRPLRYPDEALLARLKRVRLADANIPEHEFLQFRRLQSLIYTLRLSGYDTEAMETEVFVAGALFVFLKCRAVVTKCEFDMEVNDEVAGRVMARLPADAVWLTTNAAARHDRVKPYPIGITDYCGYSPFHHIIGDTERFARLMAETPRGEERLVLLNFNDATWPEERGAVRALFAPKDFVTSAAYALNEAGYANYVRGLRCHPFCLAPRGAGVDTHRIWESLYAGAIPIVQHSFAMRAFEDFPIFFVNSWEEAADEDVLRRVRDEFAAREWNLQKLTLSYWYKTVLNALGASAG